MLISRNLDSVFPDFTQEISTIIFSFNKDRFDRILDLPSRFPQQWVDLKVITIDMAYNNTSCPEALLRPYLNHNLMLRSGTLPYQPFINLYSKGRIKN